MSTTTTKNKTVTLAAGDWDTIRIALLSAKGHEMGQKGLTRWYDMLGEVHDAIKDQTV
jgi:hypothetical protein